jgi:hypothetical protein
MTRQSTSPYRFPKKYWDRPTPAAHGDANADVLFAAVGAALTCWERIEAELASLYLRFSEATSGRSREIAQRTYGIIAFNPGRVLAVRSAAEIYYENFWNSVQKELIHLLENVGDASHRRDDIAHGHVISFRADQLYRGFFLIPPEYNSRMVFPWIPQTGEPLDTLRSKYRYTSAEIRSFAEKFEFLRRRVQEYLMSVPVKTDGHFPNEWMAEIHKPATR